MKKPRKLADIDLTLPLEGTEGLDANYVTRTRTQYLYAQHQALVTQTQFADAKAAVLITLVGLVAFRGPVAIGNGQLDMFTIIYLVTIALSVLFAFIAVFPRYPSSTARRAMAEQDRWSWPALAAETLSPDEFSHFMQTSEASQLVHSVSLSNSAVSAILLAKFRMLRIAFILGLIVLALAGVRLSGLF